MATAIIVIIVLLVVATVSVAVWRNSRRSIPPAPHHGPLPPGQGPGPAHQPPVNGPGFTPLPNGGGTFKEISRTRPGMPPSPATAGQTNSFGTLRINKTAICKLTGKQIADCTCDDYTRVKKKV
jgi:hypothetical protein